MANTYKDIIITPNRSSNTADPNISFRGANSASNTEITLRVYPDANGTLSFEGSAGQLFSITNDLTGTIFSVNDISGIPSLEIDANGFVEIAAYGGNVGIGEANTSNISNKLYVKGSATVTDTIKSANFTTSAGLNITNQANNAYDKANSAATVSQAAYGQANNAYDKANSASISVTNDITTNSTYYVIFTSATSGTASQNVANTKLTFNPNTGTLSATIFNAISDREAKENIRDLGYGLDTVLSMEGKKFELKVSNETSIGFIAQDLEKIVPEVVLDHNDGYKGVNYGVIVAILVEAIKELNSKIENLKNDQ